MQTTMKKVLSILVVFVVLLGSLLVPVHAQSEAEKAEEVINPNTAKKYYSDVKPLDSEDDHVYVIRLTDAVYRKNATVAVKRFDNKKEWVGENGFVFEDNKTKITEEQITEISKIIDGKFPTEEAITEFIKKDAAEKQEAKQESDVILLETKKDVSDTKIYAHGDLIPGIYYVKIFPGDKRCKYNPAVLGVTPSGEDEPKYSLDINGKFVETGSDKGTYVKFEKSDSLLTKSIVDNNNSKLTYKVNSPKIGETVKFKVDGIYYPQKIKNHPVKGLCIEDRYPKGSFQLDENTLEMYTRNGGMRVKDGKISVRKVNIQNGIEELKELMRSDTNIIRLVKLYEGEKEPENEVGFRLYVDPVKADNMNFYELTSRFTYSAVFKGSNPDEIQKNMNCEMYSYENKATYWLYDIDKPETFEVPEDADSSSTKTYMFAPVIWKYDADEGTVEKIKADDDFTKYGLGGAKFALYKNDATTSDTNLMWLLGKDQGRAVTSYDEKHKGLVKLDNFSVKLYEASENKDKVIDKLRRNTQNTPGNTYLKEEEAPEEFQVRPGEDFKVMVYAKLNPNGLDIDDYDVTIINTKTDKSITKNKSEIEAVHEKPIDHALLWIANSKKFLLPSTGSKTMMVLTIIGVGLITGVTVVSRKKKHASSMN